MTATYDHEADASMIEFFDPPVVGNAEDVEQYDLDARYFSAPGLIRKSLFAESENLIQQ